MAELISTSPCFCVDRRRSIRLGKHLQEAAGGSSSMPFSSRLPSRAPGFEQGVLPAADSEYSFHVALSKCRPSVGLSDVLLASPVHTTHYTLLFLKTTHQVVRRGKKDASFQTY